MQRMAVPHMLSEPIFICEEPAAPAFSAGIAAAAFSIIIACKSNGRNPLQHQMHSHFAIYKESLEGTAAQRNPYPDTLCQVYLQRPCPHLPKAACRITVFMPCVILNASAMLAAGVPDKDRMKRIRHARKNMLKAICQRTMKGKVPLDDATDNYFEELIEPASNLTSCVQFHVQFIFFMCKFFR